MEEYRNLFDKLVAPLPQLSRVGGDIYEWASTMDQSGTGVLRTYGLTSMMKIAQLVENRELTRNKACLRVNKICKSPIPNYNY